jgi:hypothetical protein
MCLGSDGSGGLLVLLMPGPTVVMEAPVVTAVRIPRWIDGDGDERFGYLRSMTVITATVISMSPLVSANTVTTITVTTGITQINLFCSQPRNTAFLPRSENLATKD